MGEVGYGAALSAGMPGLGRGIADHRAGRLDGVNCSTPADARLGAVWADGQEGGHAALSSESGALAVVTDFPPNTGRLMWSGVDLTGVRELELRAAGESEPATPGFPQPEPPPRPAAGGTVEAHLGSPTGPLLGTFTIPANPGWQRTNPLAGNTMPQPGWSSYLVTLDTPVDGERDLWLVAGPPSAVAAAGAADASGQTAYGVIGSIAWLRTVR